MENGRQTDLKLWRALMSAMAEHRLLAMLLLCCLASLHLSGMAQAQSWRQEDPSAIVLPGQPGNQGSGGGGLFRLFRFEPQRQAQRQQSDQPVVEVAPRVIAPPPKDPEALAVLVLGDEFADQIHEGLVDRFDGDRMIQSFGFSVPGSGMAAPQGTDWTLEGPARAEGFENITALVVALGYSDGRDLVDGTLSYTFGSLEWQQFYRSRMTNLALTLTALGHTVIFVGMPPLADPERNEQIRLINRLIQEAVAPTRARFVDGYTAFADVEGNYAASGPNLAGEVVELRRSDGIFLNRAGREKYAQLVERFIAREGADAVEPEVSSVIYEGSALSDDGVGPLILLTSGFADPSAGLAQELSAVRPAHILTRERLLRGTVIEVPVGRADDFRVRAPGSPG